ncbi:MAG: hypothetical protein AAF602_06565 [Myxococcota bacterium]
MAEPSEPTEPSDPTPTESAAPTAGSRFRGLLVSAGIVVLVSGIVAGFVMYREHRFVSHYEALLVEAEQACDARLVQTEAERDAATEGMSRLHAFLDVVGAREQLVRGNFGNARARLEAAAANLDKGGNPELAAQARSIDIQITQDVEAMQVAIAEVEQAVRAVVDRPEAVAAE